MNKLLIGTATAALLTVPAVAGPMAVTVGGYYNAVVYSQDVDNTDTRDVGIHNDAEIYFKGKGTTNGGLEIGFMVQLEAEGSGESDHIDENYVYVKGDFGKVEIGAENNAPYKQQVAAPKIFGWKTARTVSGQRSIGILTAMRMPTRQHTAKRLMPATSKPSRSR